MKSQSRSGPPALPLPLPPDEDDGTLSQYTSFILRCRVTADGRVHLRLTEVRSGVSCFVTDLDDLPDALRRWMAFAQDRV